MEKSDGKSKSRLGLGLDALFGEKSDNRIDVISLDLIKAAPWQPRKIFEQDGLNELAQSIKRYGVLQPILLKKIPGDQPFEIIAGERRFRASKLAGLSTIPAIIVDFDMQQALEISMIENLQRRDLNPIEKAEGFAFLIDKIKISQEELATRLGISRSVITNYLRINTLDEEIKDKIASGQISAGHAKILVNKENAAQLVEEIIEKKLSVREAEKKVYNKPKTSKKPIDEDKPVSEKTANASEIKRFEEMIEKSLNMKTVIECHKNSGKVILEFKNMAQLEEIISAICL